MAKTLRNAPSERIAEVRSGASVTRCPVTRSGPRRYPGTALRRLPWPPAAGGSTAGGSGRPPATVGGGQQPGLPGVPGPGGVPLAAHLVAPAVDPSVDQPGRHGGRHGRRERRPGELVGPRPAHEHRPARALPGEQDGVEGGVVGAVVAIAAGVLDVLDDDHGGVEPERLGDGVAQPVDALAVAPDVEAPVVGPPGHPAARGDRRVDEVGLGVGRRAGSPAPDPRRRRSSSRPVRRRARPPRSSSSGRVSASSHVAAAARAARARSASSSRSPTTPRNEPSRTSRTPGAAQPSGSPTSRAAGDGGRSTRPWRRPSGRRSVRNRGRPSTLSGRSTRGASVPTRASAPAAAGQRQAAQVGARVDPGDPLDVGVHLAGRAVARRLGQLAHGGADVAQGRCRLGHRQAARRDALVGAEVGARRPARAPGRPGSPRASAATWCRAVRTPCPSSTLPTRTVTTSSSTAHPGAELGVVDDVGRERRLRRPGAARPSSPAPGSGGEDGVDDALVGAAAAEVALQGPGDLLARRRPAPRRAAPSRRRRCPRCRSRTAPPGARRGPAGRGSARRPRAPRPSSPTTPTPARAGRRTTARGGRRRGRGRRRTAPARSRTGSPRARARRAAR